MTCGSVDDGKSTLIGRLLFDADQIADDQLARLKSDSLRYGTQGDDLDYALLVDGLQAEREQGITIDVAYRYFATPARKFIVADTPGHEQYTRNMATAASVSDLAVILVDARKGLLTQTRRHSAIAHLFGIRRIVVAINKMDLVGFDQARFQAIAAAYEAFAADLGLPNVACVPVAATHGDNIVATSPNMPWYGGATLLGHLEQIDARRAPASSGFAMPVQWVCRPGPDFRGYAGTVRSGRVAAGDPVTVLPSGETTRIKSINDSQGPCTSAELGDAVMVELETEIDASRGDVIAASDDLPDVSDQFSCDLLWLDDAPMLPGRSYLLKCATQTVAAVITSLKHKIDVETLAAGAGRDLAINEIGVCNISLSKPIVYRPYEQNRDLGAFILIDKVTSQTVGAGMIRFALRRATNVKWQAIHVDNEARAAQKGQRPCCIWLTGLSGSGKSAIANALDRRLFEDGRHAFILDGDNVRHGLNRDLGFTDVDRVENIRRISEVARLMVSAGLITVVSFISPFRSERRMARELFADGQFIEVFVDTPLEVCAARDPKGLYRRAQRGEIKNFTGLDSPYEPPETPELRLDGDGGPVDDHVDRIVALLIARGFL